MNSDNSLPLVGTYQHPILQITNCTKRFPGVLANDSINLDLRKGEIHALLGENGAGKSTLVNILYGLYSQDDGEILLNGQKIEIASPSDAIAQGIGMVHQHFMLVPVMSVVENVVLGAETQHLGRFNLTRVTRRVQDFLRRINPLPHLQQRWPNFYRLARTALTWAILMVLFFGLEILLASLNQSYWTVLIAAFLIGLFWMTMLVDCLRRPGDSPGLERPAGTEGLAAGSKGAWLAIISIGNVVGAAIYYFYAIRRQPLPADPEKSGRQRANVVALALLAALVIATLASASGLLAGVVALLQPLLRLLLGLSLAYIGLWIILGLYLLLLETLMWFSELVPLGLFIDARRVREISHRYSLDVDPFAIVEDLPVGTQQRVEIVKALYREADILILDEPTAVLTPQEAEELFEVMHSLTAQGKSIIFITHKLKEVLAIADRITVLRNGRVVGSVRPQEATEASLAAMMVGREVILKVDKESFHTRDAKAVLEVRELSATDERDHPVLKGVSLTVHAGEILGVAGVQGNGQTELVRALTGLKTPRSGQVLIGGVDATGADPRTIIEMGVAHVPEDRQRDGLVLSYPIYDNLVLSTFYRPPFARAMLINEKAIFRQADDLVTMFDIRTPSIALPARNLSGGNQQKVIVARELSRPVDLIIASQPTRGLDVGSIEFIHRRLVEKRHEGVAVLLVSAELDEIMSLSDRIVVMFEGRIVFSADADKTSREELGLWMAGGPTRQ